MKIIFKNIAAEILLLLIIMVAAQGSTAAVELKELTVEEVKEIKLYENPSTGQRWQLENEKPEITAVINDDYQPLPTKEGLVGRGGIHSWSFKAEKKGFSLLKFKLLNAEADKIVRRQRFIIAVDLMTAEISRDQILEIKLAENPSTGYRWQLDLKENKSIELLKQEYEPLALNSDKNEEQNQSEKDGTQILVGQGGIKSWTLRGREAGYQLLTFELKRSGGKAIKTVEYLVLVRE
ncbi:MAG: protease inhibitor I42 family protein [Halanaerobium sp.]